VQNGITLKNTSVTLGEHFEQLIAQLLERGRYQSTSEVLREGLRLLEEREAKLEALRAALEKGEASGFVDVSFDRLNKILDEESTSQ
jgi:antitoxin ParD1/3/4